MTRRCSLCGATGVLQAVGTLSVCARQSCQSTARQTPQWTPKPSCIMVTAVDRMAYRLNRWAGNERIAGCESQATRSVVNVGGCSICWTRTTRMNGTRGMTVSRWSFVTRALVMCRVGSLSVRVTDRSHDAHERHRYTISSTRQGDAMTDRVYECRCHVCGREFTTSALFISSGQWSDGKLTMTCNGDQNRPPSVPQHSSDEIYASWKSARWATEGPTR